MPVDCRNIVCFSLIIFLIVLLSRGCPKPLKGIPYHRFNFYKIVAWKRKKWPELSPGPSLTSHSSPSPPLPSLPSSPFPPHLNFYLFIFPLDLSRMSDAAKTGSHSTPGKRTDVMAPISNSSLDRQARHFKTKTNSCLPPRECGRLVLKKNRGCVLYIVIRCTSRLSLGPVSA